MKKIDIIEELATRCDITTDKARQVLETLFEAESGEGIIVRALDADAHVTVPGFGTFGTKTREAKVAKAPGEAPRVIAEAKRYAYFKPARPLRERVAQGPYDSDTEPATAE